MRKIILALAIPLAAAAEHPVIPGLSDDLEPALAGRVLLSELNCTACHAGEIQPKGAPNLSTAGRRIRPEMIEAAILAPHAGSTMPKVLGDADKSVSLKIAAYVSSLDSLPEGADSVNSEAIERGRKLFHSVGCVACHSPESETLSNSRPLENLAAKYHLSGLTEFLENPLAVRPGGRMPDLHLNHWEAADLSNYLMRDVQPQPKIEPTLEADFVVEGKALFREHGCAQCHEPETREPDFAKPLSELNPAKNCTTAVFPLSDSQQTAIETALADLDAELESETRILLEMTRLNCFACHERGGHGGPAAARDKFFTTTNLNLGEQARIPPNLDHVGAKLDSKWLRKVVVSGASARPYINTRMPGFGAENVEQLLAHFAEVDELPKAEFTRVPDEKIARTAGFELAGDKNLSCIACHTWKGESATTLAGMEMTTMAERLQENWFHLYMRNPQEFHSTTIMPSFWPGGKAVRPELLDGDPGQQIDALWQYLTRGREARTPSGIRREPIEYGPVDGEAVMLRRQYNGIGKRGIGVGYPSGINIAFDATQMRLATVWKGDFGEMSGVWRGQGSGNVGERSREVLRFANGPGLAILESPDAEWPILEKGQRADGFQFKGYILDQKQRPTFRYTFSGLMIEDSLVDDPKGPSLVRTLTFDSAAPPGLYLRAAAGEKIPDGFKFEVESELLGRENDSLVPLAGKESITIRYTFGSE